jgi:hypothetical protein
MMRRAEYQSCEAQGHLHPGATLSSFSTRRGRTKAGPGATPDDYVMAAEDVAKIVVRSRRATAWLGW